MAYSASSLLPHSCTTRMLGWGSCHGVLRSRIGGRVRQDPGSWLCGSVRCFGAGDLKIVAARMKSVKSIEKITKAMKMVAASKLKSDQRRLDVGMPFSMPVQNLFNQVPQGTENKGEVALLCLSSDKGLCGGVNSSVAKIARQTIAANEAAGATVNVFGVGDKIRSALQRLYGDRIARIFAEVTRVPWTFATAAVIAERLIQADPARLMILHNSFKSVISYETCAVKVLTKAQAMLADRRELDQYEFEPEVKDVWDDLHEFYYACSVFGCYLDNIASEQVWFCTCTHTHTHMLSTSRMNSQWLCLVNTDGDHLCV
eukprot:GHVQ01032190.1.p1 GENE.GHVQ01032190.1~~GHVQ01032190.1.p1  ORF type:complete len:315 (-),score=32.62 GHVQ01032190.1:878-1822(-)